MESPPAGGASVGMDEGEAGIEIDGLGESGGLSEGMGEVVPGDGVLLVPTGGLTDIVGQEPIQFGLGTVFTVEESVRIECPRISCVWRDT